MGKLYNISSPQIKKTSHINKYKQISVECLLMIMYWQFRYMQENGFFLSKEWEGSGWYSSGIMG